MKQTMGEERDHIRKNTGEEIQHRKEKWKPKEGGGKRWRKIHSARNSTSCQSLAIGAASRRIDPGIVPWGNLIKNRDRYEEEGRIMSYCLQFKISRCKIDFYGKIPASQMRSSENVHHNLHLLVSLSSLTLFE